MPLADKTATLPGEDCVEVVDAESRPLGIISTAEAHRQLLAHRSAMVLVFDRLDRLCLGKRPNRSPIYPGRLDLGFCRHVGAGQSREEAARQGLAPALAGAGGQLCQHGELPACESTGFELISLFRLKLKESAEEMGLPPETYLFIGQGELKALAGEFREMFTPLVIHAFEKGALFGPDKDE